jgi:hypothetical protein
MISGDTSTLMPVAYAEQRRRVGRRAVVARALGIDSSTLYRREIGASDVNAEHVLALQMLELRLVVSQRAASADQLQRLDGRLAAIVELTPEQRKALGIEP